MKRRLLALLCVLGLTISMAAAAEAGGTPAPEDTAPVENVAPEETVPTETAEPEAMPAPEETADPEATPAPEETPAPNTPVLPYTDVPETEWYAQEVAAVTERGLMTGVAPGVFAPLSPVTRAAVVTVLWRLEGSPQPETGEAPFSDVTAENPQTAWFLPQTVWAKGAGVAAGYEDGTFRGYAPVTREELAVFLYRYALHKGQPVAEGTLGLFTDAETVSDWAQDAVGHTVGMGLFRGDELHRLNPQSTATRAELAAILQRMLSPAVG